MQRYICPVLAVLIGLLIISACSGGGSKNEAADEEEIATSTGTERGESEARPVESAAEEGQTVTTQMPEDVRAEELTQEAAEQQAVAPGENRVDVPPLIIKTTRIIAVSPDGSKIFYEVTTDYETKYYVSTPDGKDGKEIKIKMGDNAPISFNTFIDLMLEFVFVRVAHASFFGELFTEFYFNEGGTKLYWQRQVSNYGYVSLDAIDLTVELPQSVNLIGENEHAVNYDISEERGQVVYCALPNEYIWGNEEMNIFIVSIDGTGKRRLTSGLYASSPQFAPYHDEIIFGVGGAPFSPGSVNSLYKINIDGLVMANLTPNLSDIEYSAHFGRNVYKNPYRPNFDFQGDWYVFVVQMHDAYMVNIASGDIRNLSSNWSVGGTGCGSGTKGGAYFIPQRKKALVFKYCAGAAKNIVTILDTDTFSETELNCTDRGCSGTEIPPLNYTNLLGNAQTKVILTEPYLHNRTDSPKYFAFDLGGNREILNIPDYAHPMRNLDELDRNVSIVSADNRLLAFYRYITQTNEMIELDIATNTFQVTAKPNPYEGKLCYQKAFLEGDKIAFVCSMEGSPNEKNVELFISDIDGENAVSLTAATGREFTGIGFVQLIRGGREVVFYDGDGNAYLVGADGGGLVYLSTQAVADANSPAALPDEGVPEGTGILIVSSTPEGGDIYLDEQLVGVTSKLRYNVIDDVLAGDHTLKIVKSGYIDYTGSIHLEPDEVVVRDIIFEPGYIKAAGAIVLIIESEPVGVEVYIGNVFKCSTSCPTNINHLPGQAHAIKLSKDGHEYNEVVYFDYENGWQPDYLCFNLALSRRCEP